MRNKFIFIGVFFLTLFMLFFMANADLFKVETAPKTATGQLGKETVFKFYITNNGTDTDSYNLTGVTKAADCMQYISVRVPQNVITLQPNETGQIKMLVMVNAMKQNPYQNPCTISVKIYNQSSNWQAYKFEQVQIYLAAQEFPETDFSWVLLLLLLSTFVLYKLPVHGKMPER